MRPALNHLLLPALAVALGALGAVPVVDHMTHTVLRIVEPIALADWHRPYWNPAPMDAWGVRPISVLLMKGVAASRPPTASAPGLGAPWASPARRLRAGRPRLAAPLGPRPGRAARRGGRHDARAHPVQRVVPAGSTPSARAAPGGSPSSRAPSPSRCRPSSSSVLASSSREQRPRGAALLAAGAVGFGFAGTARGRCDMGCPALRSEPVGPPPAPSSATTADDARHSTWDRLPVVEHDAVQLLYLALRVPHALGATPRSGAGPPPRLALVLAPAGPSCCCSSRPSRPSTATTRRSTTRPARSRPWAPSC